jgi:LexA DNA binding domain
MGKAATLLEGLCGHALSLGAQSIQVEYQDGRQWVFANRDGAGISIANYKSSSPDAKELSGNLEAAARKPVRAVLGGQLFIIKVAGFDNFGEKGYNVSIDPAPKPDPSKSPAFTGKQGQYLAFIHYYTKIHRQSPSELDLVRYFQVSPPSVHEILKTLQRNGLIERTPGQARSIRLCVPSEHLPPLA